jgi:hypothetical protein
MPVIDAAEGNVRHQLGGEDRLDAAGELINGYCEDSNPTSDAEIA